MSVDYVALLQSVSRGQVPGLALIHGSDVQLIDDALTAVSRALFPDAAAAVFDREVFDGRRVDLETVTNAAATLPLRSARRLVTVRHCQALGSKGAEALRRYVASPNPAACLLFLADEPLGLTRDRRNAHWLLETIPAVAVVELPARRGRALEEWVRQRAGAEGLTVSEEAARLLIHCVGDDSALLLGEVRKAALAGGPDNRAVGVKEVGAVVGEHRLAGLLELHRAVERRELGLALRTLDRLLATEDPMAILAGLTREARMAWAARDWQHRGQSVDSIARALRRPAPAVEALLTSIARLPAAALAERLRRCWEAERRLKTGGEPQAEITALVAELARAG